jgi:23S rRNA (adenine2030-N6)-methyltransferase
MLSYQHIYHAGNTADIQKHLWLVTVLDYLGKKDKPLCWIDTHAGRGVYDLEAPEAQKLGEHKIGIEPVYDFLRSTDNLPEPLKIYRDALTKNNEDGSLRFYPGSALLAIQTLKSNDRLFAYDMHKGEYPHLANSLTPYRNSKTRQGDGLEHLLALLPPKEKRGGALIDPSYEIKSDYARIVKTMESALAKWAGGVYMIWYPLLAAGHHTTLVNGCRGLHKDVLVDEWIWRDPAKEGRGLYGSGMIIFNPPYTCAETMESVKQAVWPLLQAA